MSVCMCVCVSNCGQTARLGQHAPQIFIYEPSGGSASGTFRLLLVSTGEKEHLVKESTASTPHLHPVFSLLASLYPSSVHNI